MGVNVFKIFFIFIRGSRWKKASKCKRLINKLKCRLLIEKNRRETIVRQTCHDIFHILNSSQPISRHRVDQVYSDHCRLLAYEQLEQLCECIYINLGDISSTCKLASDVIEAISSLIFAAPRCGELPELQLIRLLFKSRFGVDFERVNVELLPGNNVKRELKYNLSTSWVPCGKKLQVAEDLMKRYRLSPRSPLNAQQNLSQRHDKKKRNVQKTRRGSMNKETDYIRKRNQSPCNVGVVLSSPSHVHPKLPDYDQLVAKFTDLKIDYFQKTTNNQWRWKPHGCNSIDVM